MGKRELAQIMKAIKRIREPGEHPVQSAVDIDVFECDLCKGDAPKEKISQCPYCGRWICKKNCWHNQYLACNACASIIAITQHQDRNINDTEMNDDNDTFLAEPLHTIRNLISKKKNKNKD